MQARFEKLRSNPIFEWSIIAVIVFSAVVIGIKSYELPSVLVTIIPILDWLITLIFLFEITVRFIGERDKWHFFHSGWNIFDTLVVVISLIPINDSEMALLARLVRVFRVLRMVSVVPELRVLINSLILLKTLVV